MRDKATILAELGEFLSHGRSLPVELAGHLKELSRDREFIQQGEYKAEWVLKVWSMKLDEPGGLRSRSALIVHSELCDFFAGRSMTIPEECRGYRAGILGTAAAITQGITTVDQAQKDWARIIGVQVYDDERKPGPCEDKGGNNAAEALAGMPRRTVHVGRVGPGITMKESFITADEGAELWKQVQFRPRPTDEPGQGGAYIVDDPKPIPKDTLEWWQRHGSQIRPGREVIVGSRTHADDLQPEADPPHVRGVKLRTLGELSDVLARLYTRSVKVEDLLAEIIATLTLPANAGHFASDSFKLCRDRWAKRFEELNADGVS